MENVIFGSVLSTINPNQQHHSSGSTVSSASSIVDSGGANSLNDPYSDNFGGTSEFHSVILYHNNSPRWNETIRLSLPLEAFPDAHVRLEYRHCSSKCYI